MKKLARTLTTASLSAFLVLPSVGSPKAQNSIQIDATPESLIEMSVQGANFDETPKQLIFVFDSGNITYEINNRGELALLTSEPTQNSKLKVSRSVNYTFYEKVVEEKLKVEDWMLKTFNRNEEEAEEKIELESWMMNPGEWKVK